MSFFSKNKNSKIIAIFDIGSGSVAGSIVELGGVEKPRVLFSTREDIAFQNNFKFERFLASMLRSFDVISGRVAAKGKKIENILCVLSAPWYVSQTRTIIHEKEKPFLFTQKKMDDFIEKEIIAIKKDFDNNHKSSAGGFSEILETRSTHVKLNGYETNTPFDKHVKKIELSLYVSMSSAKLLKAIREKIRTQHRVKNIFLQSFSLVSFSTLRDMYSNLSDFMILDISGESTDIVVVRKDTLVETISFPFGKHSVLRTIANRLGVSLEEAYSELHLFVEKKGTKENERKMNIILNHSGEQWLDMFKENLTLLSKYSILPAKIFLITDEPFSELFFKTINNIEYTKMVLMGEEFSVEVLQTDILAKFGKFDLDVPRDIFIIIEALFANKTFYNKD